MFIKHVDYFTKFSCLRSIIRAGLPLCTENINTPNLILFVITTNSKRVLNRYHRIIKIIFKEYIITTPPKPFESPNFA